MNAKIITRFFFFSSYIQSEKIREEPRNKGLHNSSLKYRYQKRDLVSEFLRSFSRSLLLFFYFLFTLNDFASFGIKWIAA